MQTQNDQWKKMSELPIRLEVEDRNQKPCWRLSLDERRRRAKGLGIPSGYRSLPTLRSRFTTLINNLSVKHTIGQQMILFHRFLDLTDELFIGVGAREGG